MGEYGDPFRYPHHDGWYQIDPPQRAWRSAVADYLATGLCQDYYSMKANVGETVRILFGVGEPNFVSSTSSAMFLTVFTNGSVTTPPQTDVQTVVVLAGGAAIVEFTPQVPGRYVLVDHSLSRVKRGLAGRLDVEGEDNPDIFAPLT